MRGEPQRVFDGINLFGHPASGIGSDGIEGCAAVGREEIEKVQLTKSR
jgi:hypothetical protein